MDVLREKVMLVITLTPAKSDVGDNTNIGEKSDVGDNTNIGKSISYVDHLETLNRLHLHNPAAHSMYIYEQINQIQHVHYHLPVQDTTVGTIMGRFSIPCS